MFCIDQELQITSYDKGQVPEGTSNQGIQCVPTAGTLLVLAVGETIQPAKDYYAPGPLLTFKLQHIVQVQAQQKQSFD